MYLTESQRNTAKRQIKSNNRFVNLPLFAWRGNDLW